MTTADDDLEKWLQASLAPTEHAHWIASYDLPRESDLHAVHAQLARGIREQRRFCTVEMKNEPGDCNDHE